MQKDKHVMIGAAIAMGTILAATVVGSWWIIDQIQTQNAIVLEMARQVVPIMKI